MTASPRIVRASWPGASKANPWGVPGPARIAIVGEYPGDDEAWQQRPMVGASGMELRSQLAQAGINPDDCLLTNVLDTQPPENNLAAFCMRKEDLPHGYPIHIGPCSTVSGNLYLRPDLLYNGARLRDELAVASPSVVIALGATACWALLGTAAIGELRGVVHRSITTIPYKVVPTYNPAAILRNWRLRPVAVTDLIKAAAESHSPDIVYDCAELWLRPTIEDLRAFEAAHIRAGQLHSVDVETMGDEITCVGIALDPDRAIVVPFRTTPAKFKGNEGYYWRMTENYWPTLDAELFAWDWVRRILESRDYDILGQNFMYDIQRFLRPYNIRPRRVMHDTMLAHHSVYAEMPKNLGFLGSVYTNFPRWKQLGARHATEDKRDA